MAYSDYQGYRLKVNGYIVENGMIARGTYKCSPRKRKVLKEWYDANGKRNVIYANRTYVEISFNIRQRGGALQQKVSEIFGNRQNIEAVFWNEETLQYESCSCNIEDMEYLTTVRGNELWYKETTVKITGN